MDIQNIYTRMLAGLPYLFPANAYTREHLQTAKKNLRQHFSVIGLVERFDESLMLLKREFGWQNISYMRHNTTPRQEQASEETIEFIKQDNALDMELYAYAQTLFAQQVKRQGPLFPLQVKRFQILNRMLHSPKLKAAWEQK